MTSTLPYTPHSSSRESLHGLFRLGEGKRMEAGLGTSLLSISGLSSMYFSFLWKISAINVIEGLITADPVHNLSSFSNSGPLGRKLMFSSLFVWHPHLVLHPERTQPWFLLQQQYARRSISQPPLQLMGTIKNKAKFTGPRQPGQLFTWMDSGGGHDLVPFSICLLGT